MRDSTAGIALGSNLGDRAAILREARECLSAVAVGPMRVSSLYETQPVGCEPGAPKFLNAVVEIDSSIEPHALLASLRSIETKLGRPAGHARNVSRTLDLDLLYFGDAVIITPDLQLPHPRLHTRRFVLEPLAEVRPDLVLPGCTKTVRALLQQLAETEPLMRFASQW